MSKVNQKALVRAARLIAARKNPDPCIAIAVEKEIANELVPAQVLSLDQDALGNASGLYRHLSPYQATEKFAGQFYVWARWHAKELGLSPKGLTPGPLVFLGERTFSGHWQAAQLVNQLGVPQDFFIQHAMQYLRAKGRLRVVTPGDLLDQAVVEHVLTQWSDPYNRYMCVAGVDGSWRDEVGTAELIPAGILEVIDQHIADGVELGFEQEATLAGLIGDALPEHVAQERYGNAAVAAALARQAILPANPEQAA
jgi:hypothetical protein